MKLRLKQQLVLAFGIVVAFVVATALAAVLLLDGITDAAAHSFGPALTKERLLRDWQTNVAVGVKRTSVIARASDPALVDAFAEDAKALAKRTTDLREKLEPMLDATDKPMYEHATVLRNEYMEARDAIGKLIADGHPREAVVLFENRFLPVSARYLEGINEIVERQRANIDDSAAAIASASVRARVLLLGAGLAAALLGVAAAWWLGGRIVGALRAIQVEAEAIAAGDLSRGIATSGHDESADLLRSIATMQAELRRLVGRVRDSAGEVQVAAHEIAQGSNDLSMRTEQQASNLEQTSATMDHFASAVDANAGAAREASQLVNQATDKAREGGAVVADMVATMADISEASRRIGDIIGVIDGIAFQTNILALNAAVEAARAGEQGRGFAVVASEVRALAGRSAEAAREIKTLIAGSADKVGAGVVLAGRVGQVVDEVVASISGATGLMSSITTAMTDQAQGIREVKTAIADIDGMTQRNAALVEQSAAAAGGLSGQAGELTGAIGVFRL
ncbi:methyl-accepting chemotaxis protein [Derxia gummosa]|uniref:Methyl-accepting chemotaxis protein n=1 Tax=Derxia gummosa DSM 723 TaxID=1121388 RepID=A0A8B6X5J6_9BURK|nr:methyl-accepting chemotaxis protein [Derxia gummosa]